VSDVSGAVGKVVGTGEGRADGYSVGDLEVYEATAAARLPAGALSTSSTAASSPCQFSLTICRIAFL
jgi:hypothetical protein